MKKTLIVLLGLLIVTTLAVRFVLLKVNEVPLQTLAFNNTYALEVKSGDSANAIYRQLAQQGFVNNNLFSKIWFRLHPEVAQIQQGYYEFDQGLSVQRLFDALHKGQVKQFSISLIEGLSYSQWLITIQQAPSLLNDILELEEQYQSLLALDDFCANDYASLEGCLLPDTYFYTKGTRASEVFARAYQAMAQQLDALWLSHKDTGLPYASAYEAMVMASIIEKETAVEAERNEIAGVFVNRLDRNMRLQTDPTVIYGVGETFDGNLTRKHLRTPTPYNTYTNKGLPITPIAMFGRASLLAAMQPAITDSLYFVAKGDGTHYFSSNLAQHNAAVRQYQLNKGK